MEFTITAQGDGLEVHSSTEDYQDPEAALTALSEAIGRLGDRPILAFGASVGGPVFVRIRAYTPTPELADQPDEQEV